VHLFDAISGNNCYGIRKLETGAMQVCFSSSTNSISYGQFIKCPDVYKVLFPSLDVKELKMYEKKFGRSESFVDKVIASAGYGKIRPLLNLDSHMNRINEAIANVDVDDTAKCTITSDNKSCQQKFVQLMIL
jgi:hypothetical protein